MSDEERGEDEPGSGRRARGILSRALEIWANPAHRFVILFLPFLAVVSIGYPIFVKNFNGVVQTFIHLTAYLDYWLVDSFGSNVVLDGKIVRYGGFTVKIVDECTGIYEMLIFSAAVLAFPTSPRNKVLGLLLGNPAIYVFNVARIAVLIVVGRFEPGIFDFMHVYFMQATMIVMITSVWLGWIIWVVKEREEAPTSTAPA